MKRIDHTQMGSGGQIERRNCAALHRDSGDPTKKNIVHIVHTQVHPGDGIRRGGVGRIDVREAYSLRHVSMHQRVPRASTLKGCDVAPLLLLHVRHLRKRVVFLFDVLQHLLRLRGRECMHVARRQNRWRRRLGRRRRELRFRLRLG